MTIKELFEEYFRVKILPSNRSDSTVEKYTLLGNVIDRHFGDIDIYDIKPFFYQTQFNELGKTAGYDYCSRVNRLIQKIIIYGNADGMKINDFTQGLEIFSKRPKKLREDKYLHSLEDYNRVLLECRKRFNYDYSISAYFIYILFQTGLRPAECLGLNWKNIDFKNGTITTLSRISTHTLKKSDPKTKSSIRTIPLNSEALEVLEEIKDNQKKMLKEHYMTNPDKLVFLHWSCKRLLPLNNTLKKFLWKMMDELHISPKISLYGARHTRISVLLAKGIEMDVVARYAGHNSNEMIIKTYGGLLSENKTIGFDKIKEI